MEASQRDFHHPFEPYEIQVELMNAIYDCIAQSKVGIFESPTGTGKSLSLICSSLTWLRNVQEETLRNQTTVEEEESDEPSWVVEHARIQKRDSIIEQKIELEAKLRQIRINELHQKQCYESGKKRKTKRARLEETGPQSIAIDEEKCELDEYESEKEDTVAKTMPGQKGDRGLSSASMQLMEKLGLVLKDPPKENDLSPTDELKIYLCSRTHSQLTQFVQEIRRVEFPPASWVAKMDMSPGDGVDRQIVKHISLGSRRNLCINPKVSRLGSTAAINERCLELQQPDTPIEHKCPFVPNHENESLVNDFRDHATAKVRDIEDLGTLGEKIGICPYYASRATIQPAEIVTLPYPLLLHKSAREALNISLKGHVVIVDEAHNLMDTISNINSVSITLTQLRQCRSQIGTYLQKFRNKLKGKNRVYVAQVVRLIDSLSSHLEMVATSKQAREEMVELEALMAGKGVDQINLYKLMHYLQESKLARKVNGYATLTEQKGLKSKINNNSSHQVSTMPVLTHVQSFLQTLTNPAAEGRFFYEKDGNEVSLKYMLLDPTHYFKEVVEDARAIILAGGTMSPMDDYLHHLFAYVDPERLTTFSCGHIIPKENLIALQIAKGPGDQEFDFTYEKRNTSSMIEALGHFLIQLCSTVPDGLVVFFPSYAYLDQVAVGWQIKPKGPQKSIWDHLLSKKTIFCDSKTTSADEVLNQYSQAISCGQGGLLFSVIGGKLSEGINFSDSLGRGVVVVGLPFPNIHSAQWKAKLEYIEQAITEKTGKDYQGKAAARDFYENACMRAVNQSIGRAIRHKGDYASIVLLDKRYATQRIEGKLPGWIRQGIPKGGNEKSTDNMIQKLESFFKSKRMGKRENLVKE